VSKPFGLCSVRALMLYRYKTTGQLHIGYPVLIFKVMGSTRNVTPPMFQHTVSCNIPTWTGTAETNIGK